MPDYSVYPAAADVELLLKSAKFWPADSDTTGVALAREQAEIAAEGAVAEFERRTGWLPFLASGEIEERVYDATDYDGLLDLGAGLLSASPTVTVGGSTYTLNTQYWLQPSQAARQGKPFTMLRFTSGLYSGGAWPGTPNRISISGVWGYATRVPADVWVAIQKYAAVQALMSIENLQSVASISQDGFSKGYDIVGIITQKDLMTTWNKDWDKVCARYTRIVC